MNTRYIKNFNKMGKRGTWRIYKTRGAEIFNIKAINSLLLRISGGGGINIRSI